MTKEEVTKFVQAINTFHWQNGFESFCKALDFQQDDYARSKYEMFQQLLKGLNAFDPASLTNLANYKGKK